MWSTDTKGNLLSNYSESTVFGEGDLQASRSARFTGKPYDEDMHAYVFPFRNYDATTARWISADPSGHPDATNNQFYACIPTNGIDLLELANLGVYGRPLKGAPAGTHTYGRLTVNSGEYSQLSSSQQSHFNSNGDGTYTMSVGGYKSDNMVANPNSPAGMGYYLQITYNNPKDSNGTMAGNVTNSNGSSDLEIDFVRAFVDAASNFESNQYSSLYAGIPITSKFDNCNSLLSQLIDIAGGVFDESLLPWDAIGWGIN